jgi:hypothetical protein
MFEEILTMDTTFVALGAGSKASEESNRWGGVKT